MKQKLNIEGYIRMEEQEAGNAQDGIKIVDDIYEKYVSRSKGLDCFIKKELDTIKQGDDTITKKRCRITIEEIEGDE